MNMETGSLDGQLPLHGVGDKLRMAGVKLYADGALGSRGASLKAPYADMPSTKGLRIVGDTQLKNMMSRAALDKFQVAVHAIGDRGNAEVLSAIEELGEGAGEGDLIRVALKRAAG